MEKKQNTILKKVKRSEYLTNLVIGVVKATVRKLVGREKFVLNKYNGKNILSNVDANRLLKESILKGEPFMAARFGDGELRSVVCYMNRVFNIQKKYPEYVKIAMGRNAGFFPVNNNELDAFGELMLQSCREIDILAVWFNLLEDYVYRSFGPSYGKCMYLKGLEPFWYDEPWTSALQGKRVLVIHPFTDTIQSQYRNRDKLFKNKQTLPEFQLIPLKAVQSIGGGNDRFASWFEALEWMFEEAMKIEFDVALIGCGAYGLPLAAKLKKANKIAIHMGGVTQFMFGIKGARWDASPDYIKFYNDYWCRASGNEIPQVAKEIENGCYW